MFPASCILLWLAVALTDQQLFTYVRPWSPFRRSLTDCEMCYKGVCEQTDGPRCEYYADASKLIADDEDDDDDRDKVERETGDDKMDNMIFDLVQSGSSTPYFKGCIPLISQYTDCTEENICTGCKFCSCSDEGTWICNEKQKCSPEPKLTVDHRVIGIVIEGLKRKKESHQRRGKRSATKDKLTYSDLSKWLYDLETNNNKQKDADTGEIWRLLKDNETKSNQYNQGQVTPSITNVSGIITDTSIKESENYLDLLEFNDILNMSSNDDASTIRPVAITELFQIFNNHLSQDMENHDLRYSEYDPIHLIKRDTSKHEIEQNVPQINTTNNNITYELIFTDAVQGLHKITIEKQKELEELLNIQNNLLTIAKAHNITINTNSTINREDYNKHQIAIYKLGTFEKCVTKVKNDICSVIAEVINTEALSNSSYLQRELKIFFNTITKYIKNEKGNETPILSSHEYNKESRHYIHQDNKYQSLHPIKHMSNILEEVIKEPGNPLQLLSHCVHKILKRVIKQLYFNDFAVIDYIVHETYYDFDSYMENIGNKWHKMMQDVTESDIFDALYRLKLLHLTLKADISKMEDMITLLDFARNRRMTVANGGTFDKSISRIQNNLRLIDTNVQKIMNIEKSKRMRQATADTTESSKKKSILQKLKKMFQNSKKDIKEMLRKRFPKSEIMKRIAKKKIEELETRKMLDYQETRKEWQENFNGVPGRVRRSVWGIPNFVDNIRSIIPGYLRRKVKPVMHKKIGNNSRITTEHEQKERLTKPTTH